MQPDTTQPALPTTARLFLGVDLLDPSVARTVRAIGPTADGIEAVEFESNQAAEEALNRVDGQRSSASWGLRWVWNNPAVSVVLSGMTTFEQLEANLHDAGDPTTGAMRAEELEAVAAVREALLERIKVPCTACGYCMPCPVGVNIPGCFNFYNNVAMFGPDNAYNFWMAPQQKAGNCVGCRKCESHCPQEIKISEELKQVVQLFGA